MASHWELAWPLCLRSSEDAEALTWREHSSRGTGRCCASATPSPDFRSRLEGACAKQQSRRVGEAEGGSLGHLGPGLLSGSSLRSL